MRVLGIDPGIAITGYGVVDGLNGKLIPIDYGSITTLSTQPVPERLKTIYSDLNKIIEAYKPDIIAVEELFFAANVKTAIVVGEARGVIILAAANNNIQIEEYTPLEVKQAITGYGTAQKNQVQYMVKNLLNLTSIPKPDDAADGLAIAICHIFSNKIKNLTREK